jgi:hypothetical protein
VRIIGQLKESIATISSRHARLDAAFWAIATDIVLVFQRELPSIKAECTVFRQNLGIINFRKSKVLLHAICLWGRLLSQSADLLETDKAIEVFLRDAFEIGMRGTLQEHWVLSRGQKE